MKQSLNLIEDAANSEWAIQSEKWIEELAKLQKSRKLRERNSNPLILSGHGNSMRIDKGRLLIKEGFTHYPQKQSIHCYFKGDLNCPKRILLLDGSGSLSFEVLDWLSQQGVTLIRINWVGDIVLSLNSNGNAFDRKLVNWQYETRHDPKLRSKYASWLITQKLKNSIIALKQIIPDEELRNKAIEVAKAGIVELQLSNQLIAEIQGIEGKCASAYFQSWQSLKLNWNRESRYPVPDNWKKYSSRSSILTGIRARIAKAAHPINAMLNYAYTVKQSQLQIEALAKGYDPAIGIMHLEGKGNSKGRSAFIFDLIEPERPKIDALILKFALERTFSGADFVIRDDGVCRLSPQLTKIVAALVMNAK